AMRKDRTEFPLDRQLRCRPMLAQIRPHGLEPALIRRRNADRFPALLIFDCEHFGGRVLAWDTGLDHGSVAYGIAAAPEPRVRVIAGPGTGKSFAMKRRVARLLESGIGSNEILAVTFTRVAAEDLHRELQKLDTPGCEALKGQTLHSLAMRILSRKHVLEAVGRAPRPLNTFETKAMICDLAGPNGGKRAVKRMIQNYTAAWAQSQGDEPGFAKTDE